MTNKRVDAQKARLAVTTLGLPVDVDPFEALLEEVRRTAGHVRWLQAIVANIPFDDFIWNKTTVESATGAAPQGNYDIIRHESTPSVWMDLYQKERDKLVVVCKVAIGCGIAERQVKLAEQESALIAQVVQATFADPELDLTAEQQDASKRIAARHLRLVMGGQQDNTAAAYLPAVR